jgi:hypothetical protein
MTSTIKPASACPGPLSRREFLRWGALGLGGAGLANLLGQRAAAKETGRSVPDTSVIFLFPGGLFVEVRLFDGDAEDPWVEIVNAHPQV